MNIRNEIFGLVINSSMRSGDILNLNRYNTFIEKRKLNRKQVNAEMEQLCNEGVFEYQEFGELNFNFRLTDKGEEVIYK